MKKLETWLSEYSNDHQNNQNQRLHKICVPLIFATVVGGFHLLPYHIGHAVLLLALLWYAALGLKAFALAASQAAAAVGLTVWLQNETSTKTTVIVLAVIFALGWIGQFIGHHFEGRRPSFLKDLQYLLVGPLWVWLGH